MLEPLGPKGQVSGVAMNCDRIVFNGEGPQLPTGAPITTFSQRYSGQQTLPIQVNIIIITCVPFSHIIWSNEQQVTQLRLSHDSV